MARLMADLSNMSINDLKMKIFTVRPVVSMNLCKTKLFHPCSKNLLLSAKNIYYNIICYTSVILYMCKMSKVA